MELIVKLKQHTPIIHFQHDQKGATLRATELKPKLDRYIKEKYNIDMNNQLKYQVKIKYTATPQPPKEPSRDGLYFGNMGNNVKQKKEMIGDELELKFNTYFDNNLKKQIEETLPVCLALENFGTRNNKGYGCFFLADKNRDDFETVLKTQVDHVYYWDCNNDPFFSIKTVYSILKSGININGVYYKSLLYQYFKDLNITWDKKAIKMAFLPNASTDSWSSDNQQFVRGILGFSETQEWRSYHETLTIKSAEFERVPSPLIFKIFDNGTQARVYFFAREFYKQVLGKDFEFDMNTERPITLKTPVSFDITNYLDWAIDKINNLPINTSGVPLGIVKRTDDIIQEIKNKKIHVL